MSDFLPQSLLPLTLLDRATLSKLYFLETCPKKDLFLTVFSCSLPNPAHRKTVSCVTLSVHEIGKILQRNHISAALILLTISLSTFHCSHPYRRKVHTYTFTILILLWMEMFLLLVTSFIAQIFFSMAFLMFTLCRLFPIGGEEVA